MSAQDLAERTKILGLVDSSFTETSRIAQPMTFDDYQEECERTANRQDADTLEKRLANFGLAWPRSGEVARTSSRNISFTGSRSTRTRSSGSRRRPLVSRDARFYLGLPLSEVPQATSPNSRLDIQRFRVRAINRARWRSEMSHDTTPLSPAELAECREEATRDLYPVGGLTTAMLRRVLRLLATWRSTRRCCG